MIRFARTLMAAGLAALLAGCPAFFVERGEIVTPAKSADRPAARALPPADAFVEREDRWRREIRIGLGGHAVATLWDPGLGAAAIAHEAALQNLRGPALESMIANRWATWYGEAGDRFPIDVTWRFDEQFISKPQILDPAQWTIRLHTGDGRTYAPISVATLRAESAPRGGYWEGAIRLWFPWRDPDTKAVLLGGGNSGFRLELDHPSGSGAFYWRFGTAY